VSFMEHKKGQFEPAGLGKLIEKQFSYIHFFKFAVCM
jgi:hypothetical protein